MTESGPTALPGRIGRWLNVPMKILLVANNPLDAQVVEQSLTHDGHAVAICNDQHGGPCRGVAQLEACPLESSVDLAVIARSSETRRGLGEMGSVCAARHRVGVVEIDPDEPLSGPRLYDLADEAERHICRDYEATVDATLREVVGPEQPFSVAVRRHGRDVHVTLTLNYPASVLERVAVADRARAGVRRHDRFSQVIDVSVLQRG